MPRSVEGSVQARAIIRAVLALGKSLDVSVLAEGVEPEAQLKILENEGCHEAQDYPLSMPVPNSFDATSSREASRAA